jgi:hypothetical protein
VVEQGDIPDGFEQELQDEMVFRLDQVLTAEETDDPMWSAESSVQMSWYYGEE